MEELTAAKQALAHGFRREATSVAIIEALEPTGIILPLRQGRLS